MNVCEQSISNHWELNFICSNNENIEIIFFFQSQILISENIYFSVCEQIIICQAQSCCYLASALQRHEIETLVICCIGENENKLCEVDQHLVNAIFVPMVWRQRVK